MMCEFCGSLDVIKQRLYKKISLPFSESIEYVDDVIHCNTCGENKTIGNEVDINAILSKENPQYVNVITNSIMLILSELDEKGYNQARIERAFDIPRHSISRWITKLEFPSESSIALLRLLKISPILINIAEHNYEM